MIFVDLNSGYLHDREEKPWSFFTRKMIFLTPISGRESLGDFYVL